MKQTPEIAAELRALRRQRQEEYHNRHPIRRIDPNNFHFGNGKQIKKLVVLETFDYHCFYCNRPLDYNSASQDHLNPQIRGGRHAIQNLVLSCKPCNRKKGGRLPTEKEMARAAKAHAEYRLSQVRKDLAIHRQGQERRERAINFPGRET